MSAEDVQQMESELTTNIDLALAPVDPLSAGRFRLRVSEAIQHGDGVIAVWMPDRRAAITGVVLNGELQSWSIYPAENEAAAQCVAEFQHSVAERIVETHMQLALPGASEAIKRASDD